MMDLISIATIVVAHFVGDFVLQTDWMAKGKSRSNLALSAHVGVYWATLAVFTLAYSLLTGSSSDRSWDFVVWVSVNSALHFFVDYATSRFNARLWERGNVHDFFVGVGFDQSIHSFTLFATWSMMV